MQQMSYRSNICIKKIKHASNYENNAYYIPFYIPEWTDLRDSWGIPCLTWSDEVSILSILEESSML